MRSLDFRFILPIILAVLIGIIVSFAVQGFISFVSFFQAYLRGDNHILLGLPKPFLILSGPIIAGVIVAIIFKLANLDRWHGPAESILAAHVTSKRPDTEAGTLWQVYVVCMCDVCHRTLMSAIFVVVRITLAV